MKRSPLSVGIRHGKAAEGGDQKKPKRREKEKISTPKGEKDRPCKRASRKGVNYNNYRETRSGGEAKGHPAVCKSPHLVRICEKVEGAQLWHNHVSNAGQKPYAISSKPPNVGAHVQLLQAMVERIEQEIKPRPLVLRLRASI